MAHVPHCPDLRPHLPHAAVEPLGLLLAVGGHVDLFDGDAQRLVADEELGFVDLATATAADDLDGARNADLLELLDKGVELRATKHRAEDHRSVSSLIVLSLQDSDSTDQGAAGEKEAPEVEQGAPKEEEEDPNGETNEEGSDGVQIKRVL